MNDTVCGNSGIGKKKFQHESHFADLAFERQFESTVGKVSANCTPQTMAANSMPRETLQDDQNSHKNLNESVNDLMENCVGSVVDVAPVYCDLTLSSRRNRQADVINCILPIGDVLQNNGGDYSPSIQQKVSTDTDIRYIPQDSSSKCLIYSEDFISLSTSVNGSSSEKEISSSNYTIEEEHNLSINKLRISLVHVRNQMLIKSDLRPSVRRSHSLGELGVQEHYTSNNISHSNTLSVCQMARSKNMPSKSDLQPSVRRSYSVGQEHNEVTNIETSITLPVGHLTRNRNTLSESDLQPSVRRSHSVGELSRQGHNVGSNIASSYTPCNMAENTSMHSDSDLQPSDRSRRLSLPPDKQNQCFRKRIAQKVHRESLKSGCSLNGQKAYKGHGTLGHSSTLEMFDCNQFKETSVQPDANVNKQRNQSEKTNALRVQSIKTSAENSLELDMVKDIESKSVDCESGTSFDFDLANSENSNLSCKQSQPNKGVSALQASRTMHAGHRRISLPLDEIKICHENDGDNYLTCLSGQQANNANKLKDNNPETYHKTKSDCKVGRKRRRINSGTETSASVKVISPGNYKRLKKRSSYSDIFVKGKSHSSIRLLSNSSDSFLKSSLDEFKQKCSKNWLREGIQAVSESNDMVRGVTKTKRSNKPSCGYKKEQNEINKLHETIAASADQIALCSTTAENDSNVTDTVGGLNLEKVIPLGALTPAMKNIRKAKLKTKSRKGALHRIPSKETIWININSKY